MHPGLVNNNKLHKRLFAGRPAERQVCAMVRDATDRVQNVDEGIVIARCAGGNGF